MEPQYIEQPHPTRSLADLLPTHQVDTRSPRQRFTDEAFIKLNQARKGKYHPMSQRSVAIMVNIICPKEASDSFILDCQKQCQVAKNYSSTFWWMWKEAKKVVI